jgi:hypothetical protein
LGVALRASRQAFGFIFFRQLKKDIASILNAGMRVSMKLFQNSKWAKIRIPKFIAWGFSHNFKTISN